jgi:mannosyl-glycoprotein endo-beta-N-acetylglucosaminidase
MKNIGKAVVLSTGLLVASAGFSAVPWNVMTVEAASTVKLNKTTYQTNANLNMRSGAGTNYKVIITIPKGKTVTATEKKGNWYKVSYQYTSKGKSYTKTGWVHGSYLVQKPSSSTKENPAKNLPQTTPMIRTTYQTTTNLNMRSGAGTNYKVIITIPKGKTVTATEKKGNWYKVSYQYTSKGKSYTKTGWVSGSYLKEYDQYIKTSGTYYFTKKKANLYSTPNTKNKAVTSLASGNGLYSTRKVVNSVGQTWYEVSFNGKKLYVISSDVEKVSSRSFALTKYIANKETFLYSSFGNGYSKLEKIAKGTIVSSSFSVGNWYKVIYKDKIGYIYINDFARYTGDNVQQKPSSPAPQPPAPQPPAQEQPKQPDGKRFAVRVNLNVRKEPNTTSVILTTIPKGTIIVPTHKTSNGWYKVTYAGMTGYVSGSYVTEVKTGAPLDGVRDGYQFIDLRTEAPVTAQQINRYIENYVNSTKKQSVLLGKGQAFINAGKKYGVNALYLAAHAIHESGFGTSRLALTKYNLFGYGAFDAAPFVAAYRFPSVEASIEYIAQRLKATYLNPNSWLFKGAYLGFRTNTLAGIRVDESSEGMNFYYASDPYWGQIIASHMANILAYDKNYYKSAKRNETVPKSPGIPQGSDVFPANIVAVANQDLPLYAQKGANKSATIMKKGSTFMLLEKTNDYWVRVKYNNKQYWTNSIKFDNYKKYITVKNLGSVNAITLNVRPTPSTEKAPIGVLKMGEYVQLSLTKDGKPETQKQNSWYKVVLKDGRVGWVSSRYIIRELN